MSKVSVEIKFDQGEEVRSREYNVEGVVDHVTVTYERGHHGEWTLIRYSIKGKGKVGSFVAKQEDLESVNPKHK